MYGEAIPRNLCIPAGAYASTEEAVLKIPSALDVTMYKEDINIFHKIKSKGAGTILERSLNTRQRVDYINPEQS